MRVQRTLLTAAICLSSAIGPPIIHGSARAGEVATEREYEIGVQAYVYAYPLIMMEVTRRGSTNVPAPQGVFAPMNQFAHLRAFPDHTFREVVRPNADTLYSIAWLDVSDEPMVISVPATDRYYMLPMLDMWTDVFAAPGTRTSGTKAADFAVVGPNWKGELPQGIEKIRCPTSMGWIIGRTQTNGPSDYKTVHDIQDGFKLTPLSHFGKPYAPPKKVAVNDAWKITEPPPAYIAKMSPEAYFELFAGLLKENPPHEMDWNIVAQLKQIGIVPGKEFDFSSLPTATQTALRRAVGDAQKMISEHTAGDFINGWNLSREVMGNYGTSYLQRAYVALIGLGANVVEDAIYPMSRVDAKGELYNGSNRYVLHFDKDQIPPVRAFWSLAMYDADGYFVDNPLKRYSIGDRDKLKFTADGSLDILIQHKSPGKSEEANWLPAPAGDFNLVIRLYWPETPILTGAWNPPAVRMAKE